MRNLRSVYVASAEFSARDLAPLDPELTVGPAFFARGDGITPHSLSAYLHQAAELAILRTAQLRAGETEKGDFAAAAAEVKRSIGMLRVATMPDLVPLSDDLTLGLYSSRLKTSLGLAHGCSARLEAGSSDAGAAVFASTVWELAHADEPTCALVVAGQVHPDSETAGVLRQVARVLDPEEQRLGLTMLSVGDLLTDYYLWRLKRGGHPCWDGTSSAVEAADRVFRRACASKMALAKHYRAAARTSLGAHTGVFPGTNLLHGSTIARAGTGACAVLLTNSPALVPQHQRLVRVLGTGIGETHTAMTARPEPLAFHRAIRESLGDLCGAMGVRRNFLRASSFCVLHDAFSVIELAFLEELGLPLPVAVERLGTPWANPYGGLLAFHHSFAASGLVQIAKAFHVLVGSRAHIDRSDDLHPKFRDLPARCLTTSVGGPLSHVVCTVLAASERPADPSDDAPARPVALRFRGRHGSSGTASAQAEFLNAALSQLARLVPPELAVVEGVTHVLSPGAANPQRPQSQRVAMVLRQTPPGGHQRHLLPIGDEALQIGELLAVQAQGAGLVRDTRLAVRPWFFADDPQAGVVWQDFGRALRQDRSGQGPHWLAAIGADAAAASDPRGNAHQQARSVLLELVTHFADWWNRHGDARSTPPLPAPLRQAIADFGFGPADVAAYRRLLRDLGDLLAVEVMLPQRSGYFGLLLAQLDCADDDTERLDCLGQQLRIAEAWLAGTELTIKRHRREFQLTTRLPANATERSNDRAEHADRLLGFARELLQLASLARLQLRVVVTMGPGLEVAEPDGRQGVVPSAETLSELKRLPACPLGVLCCADRPELREAVGRLRPVHLEIPVQLLRNGVAPG